VGVRGRPGDAEARGGRPGDAEARGGPAPSISAAMPARGGDGGAARLGDERQPRLPGDFLGDGDGRRLTGDWFARPAIAR